MSKPAINAPVLEHHRLAVLRAHGITTEWLESDGRGKHITHKWLKQGTTPSTLNTPSNALFDRLAQELANAEAVGRGEATVYREAVQRLVDRFDRTLEEEFGQPKSVRPPPPVEVQPVPVQLKSAIEAIKRFDHNAYDMPSKALNDLHLLIADLVLAYDRL